MAKKRNPSVTDLVRMIKNGYGQGEGKNYKPFFKARDVPSQGECREVRGVITGRIHHLLSKLEYFVFILAERIDSVADLREQYALLPVEETIEIAKKLGIRYPTIPYSGAPCVMTTDLVISTVNNDGMNLIPVSVKPSSKIIDSTNEKNNCQINKRLQKLAIEKVYWESRGWDWKLITEKSFSMIEANNVANIRKSLFLESIDNVADRLLNFQEQFCREWRPERLLGELLNEIAFKANLSKVETWKNFSITPACYRS